jgi:hypothetical protein
VQGKRSIALSLVKHNMIVQNFRGKETDLEKKELILSSEYSSENVKNWELNPRQGRITRISNAGRPGENAV